MLFDYRWLSNQYNFLHSYSCWFFLCARLSFYSSPKELVLSRCTYQQLLEMSTWTKQVNHVLSTSISLQSLIKYLLTDWISIKIDSVRSPATVFAIHCFIPQRHAMRTPSLRWSQHDKLLRLCTRRPCASAAPVPVFSVAATLLHLGFGGAV